MNRFKHVLGCCISPSQFAFVPSRQILDNVLIAYEYIHFLNHKRSGRDGYMAVKRICLKLMIGKNGSTWLDGSLPSVDKMDHELHFF